MALLSPLRFTRSGSGSSCGGSEMHTGHEERGNARVGYGCSRPPSRRAAPSTRQRMSARSRMSCCAFLTRPCPRKD
eukprot:scaffold5586_cov124-Isochrysis_galbana.AAC.6